MPKPPKKIYKSLDDDADVTNIMDVLENGDVEKDENEIVPDEAIGEEVEKDDVQVSTSGDDDVSVSLTSIRHNPPPPKNWADGIKTKFQIGELVNIKGTPTSIFKVVGTCNKPNTYVLKPSGCDTTRSSIHEDDIKKAPRDAVWVDYWDTIVDPYRDWKRKQEAAKASQIKQPITVKEVKKKPKKKKK